MSRLFAALDPWRACASVVDTVPFSSLSVSRPLARYLAFMVLWVVGSVSPSRATDLPPLRADQSPLFTADVAVSLDPTGSTNLSVTITLANDELQWLKLGSGYGAAAEFTVVIGPKKSGASLGDSWERRLTVGSFESTNSAVASMVERRTFHVAPGRYKERVRARDVNGERSSSASEDVDVPDYSRVDVGFADLEVGVWEADSGFAPVSTRRFGHNIEQLAARATLFDRRHGTWPRSYVFRYRVLDEAGQELITGRKPVTLPESATPVVVRPDSSSLFIGGYVFEVDLEEGKSKVKVERSFEVEESGPPRGREFQRMLEPLSYVASSEEIDRLKSAPVDQQPRAWEEFWRRRDPTPDTPRNEALIEFLRRVRYAEQHFEHFGPGWRSDMGRIYIKYGAPDQTESRQASAQSPQLEIWYYNRPYRRFVFADREGFGRFVLVSPTPE